MKPGDTVWHHATQRSFTVAVIDPELMRFLPFDPEWEPGRGDEWVELAEVVPRHEGTREVERAMLLQMAKRPGRVGVVARAEIGRQWGDGTWGK